MKPDSTGIDHNLLRFLVHDTGNALVRAMGALRNLQKYATPEQAADLDHLEVSLRRIRSTSVEVHEFNDTWHKIAPLKVLPVDPELLGNRLKKLAGPELEAQKMELEVSCNQDTTFLATSEALLTQVLLPLVREAIRFGAEGHVIRLTLQREGDQVCLELADPGRALDEAPARVVFQDDDHTATFRFDRTRRGCWFTYPIMRKFVAAMGGKIRLTDSGQESGMVRMEIRLPAAPADQARKAG